MAIVAMTEFGSQSIQFVEKSIRKLFNMTPRDSIDLQWINLMMKWMGYSKLNSPVAPSRIYPKSVSRLIKDSKHLISIDASNSIYKSCNGQQVMLAGTFPHLTHAQAKILITKYGFLSNLTIEELFPLCFHQRPRHC